MPRQSPSPATPISLLFENRNYGIPNVSLLTLVVSRLRAQFYRHRPQVSQSKILL